MKMPGAGTGLLALAVVSMALTACGGSDSKVSVDHLQKAADAAIADPKAPCPLGLDLNAALKKAGIAATATPGAATPDGHAVDADSTTGADRDAALRRFDGAIVTCSYQLSTGGFVDAMLAGVHKPRAIDLIAPILARDGDMPTSVLRNFIGQKFDTGKAVLTPDDGLAAVVALKAAGGDAMLEVRSEPPADQGADAKHPIVREPLRMLAEELGRQVKI